MPASNGPLRTILAHAFVSVALLGCDGGGSSNGTDGGGGGSKHDARSTHDGSVLEIDGAISAPPNDCTTTIPTEAELVDTSAPNTVVGDGSATSCTIDALASAVAKGGTITFDCGDKPVTIAVTSTLSFPTDKDSVLDGGNKVILDGGDEVRILEWDSPGWMTNEHSLTVQRIAFTRGRSKGETMFKSCPSPCSGGYEDGQGGAIYMRDGALRVIDSLFANNHAAEIGPDTGGGAIYIMGAKNPAFLSGSTFRDNTASNAGAIGALFADWNISNCLFDNNEAVGNGANNIDKGMCSCLESGQVGSGGNGGAIYSDGVAKGITLCGVTITNNKAVEFGAAVFFTSNDQS
ncbi:MAG: hypothetical protein KC417_01495 [Myxococcales bacterium]|nr:hypothetical protein [Myxococcales bacterium]